MCLTAIQKKPLCVVTMLSKVIEAGSVDYVKFFFHFLEQFIAVVSQC